MIVKGNRDLNYSVIHVYSHDINRVAYLVNFLKKTQVKYIPVFYTNVDFTRINYEYIIRTSILPSNFSKTIHHILYDIKTTPNYNDLDKIFHIMKSTQINICYYFNKQSTKLDRQLFIDIRDNLKGNSSIYPSFTAEDKPDFSLVDGLFTEKQYVTINNNKYSKYDTTYNNKVWTKTKYCICDIFKYILYFDTQVKLCPNDFNSYNIDNTLLTKLLTNKMICRCNSCTPYLLEYGKKELR